MVAFDRSWRRGKRVAVVIAIGALLSVGTAACSSGGGKSDDFKGATSDDIAAALQKESTLTIWSWVPRASYVVEQFEKKYPNVKVDLVNAGDPPEIYTKLDNAIKAGSGVPDLIQVDYKSMPQLGLSGDLEDLSQIGFDSYEDQFTASAWQNVNVGGGLWALPEDSGPMALFYNQAVFDKFGISVPTTWDEYLDAARKIHAADPNVYITNDIGAPEFVEGMIWAAGGHPFGFSGESDVSIDLKNDEGAKKFAEVWNPMVQEGLVAPVGWWTDEWYRGLGDGTIASLVSGAWLPPNLPDAVPESSGDWRVAPLPTFGSGATGNGEEGGSAVTIPVASTNKLVAAGYIEFSSAGDGAHLAAQNGFFPSTVADLDDPSFLSYTMDYFGDQQFRNVLVQSAKDVKSGWSWLPFQAYADTVFTDTVGKIYESKGDLSDGLAAWQDALVTYAKQQGFTVKE